MWRSTDHSRDIYCFLGIYRDLRVRRDHKVNPDNKEEM